MKCSCQQSFDHSVCATAINVNIKKCRYSLWGQDWFHKIAKVVTKQMDDSVENAENLRCALNMTPGSISKCNWLAELKSFKQLKVVKQKLSRFNHYSSMENSPSHCRALRNSL